MKYMGSKRRIAKDILPIILKNRTPEQFYIEPFCGGCNTIELVEGKRIANDYNEYVAEMWNALVNRNWQPPTEITEDIHGICEQMEYQDSSRFSYNIDRLKMFVEELNNFQIKGK